MRARTGHKFNAVALPFDEPWTVARWRFGWLAVTFADGVRGVFSSWDAALFTLETERLKVR